MLLEKQVFGFCDSKISQAAFCLSEAEILRCSLKLELKTVDLLQCLTFFFCIGLVFMQYITKFGLLFSAEALDAKRYRMLIKCYKVCAYKT